MAEQVEDVMAERGNLMCKNTLSSSQRIRKQVNDCEESIYTIKCFARPG